MLPSAEKFRRGVVSAVSGSTENRNLVRLRAHTTRGDTDRAVGRAREIRARPVRDAIRPRADDPADVRRCDRVKSGFNVWRSHTCAGGRGGGRPHTAAHAGAARTHTSHGHTPHTSVSLLSPGGGPAPGFQKHPGTLRSKIFATRIHRRIQEGSTKGRWKHESEIVSYSYTPLSCPTRGLLPLCTYHEQMYRGCSLLRGRGAARGR